MALKGQNRKRIIIAEIKDRSAHSHMQEFKLEKNEFIELNDLMKITGMCESGGMAKAMIADGKVMIDGKVELRRRCKLRAGQIVTVGDREVQVV